MTTSNLPKDEAIMIPEDIIIHHILPKLPPKSLVCFQCVNKLWKSIISDPNFKISPQHRTQTLLIRSGKYKLLKNDDLSIPLLLEEPYAPHPLPDIDIFFGSCNGLVLFSISCDIFLWNPATLYCQKVLKLYYLECISYDCHPVLGFCYDASTNDYVVLAALRQFSPGRTRPLISSTLKLKDWRLVSFPYEIDSIIAGPIVNNLLHWLASPEDVFGQPNTIIYFNAPSNRFNELPSPDPINEGQDDKLVGLGVFHHCLCLMRIDRGNIELVVMKEYGVKESWTTMLCIEHHGKYHFWRMELLLHSWNVDVILFNILGEIHAYYPRTKTMKEINNVLGVPRFTWSIVIPYVEALDSPTGYYWNEELHVINYKTR